MFKRIYNCNDCQDTGYWVHRFNDRREVVECKCKVDPYRPLRNWHDKVEAIEAVLGTYEEHVGQLAKARLDTFSTNHISSDIAWNRGKEIITVTVADQRAALVEARDYCSWWSTTGLKRIWHENYENADFDGSLPEDDLLELPWLFIHGPVGTGKSHLATSIINDDLRDPSNSFLFGIYTYAFLNVPTMLEKLQAGFEDKSYISRLEVIKNIDLLVLDDLGTEKPTEWNTQQLFNIVDYRYKNRLATVFTSNDAPEDYREARIASRLTDYSEEIVLPVMDYRRHRKMVRQAARKYRHVAA